MTAVAFSTPIEAIGGVVLKAAGAVTASAGHTAIPMGRSAFDAQIDVTACDVASTDELYIVDVEANTQADPTDWQVIGVLLVCGATAKVASMGDAPQVAFSVKGAFKNYRDNQVRLRSWISGTTPSITFSAKAYPLSNIQY